MPHGQQKTVNELFNDLINMRYLTKSRFKLAEECPTKLFYTKKQEYPDKKMEDPFLVALAEGGFQVGELAKCYFPGGTDIKTLEYDEALQQTNELLKQENAVIYEAAIRFRNLFIRADVLVKKGSKLYLYEVKAKSCDFGEETGFLNTSGYLTPGWRPYVYDVAFQKHVLVNAFPENKVSSYLLLVDKNSKTTVEGLNQKFQLAKDETGRTMVNVVGDTSLPALGEKILITINVDNLVSRIWSGTDSKDRPLVTFSERIEHYSEAYKTDTLMPGPITPNCWKCEFNCTSEEEMHGYRSGFKECLQRGLGWDETKFVLPTVFEIWDNRRKDRMIADGKFFQFQLSEDDLSVSPDGSNLSRTERQWLQVQKSVTIDNSVYFDKNGYKEVLSTFKYPLHFIDFETSMVAIPFNNGRHPYEQIAFQFSHHTLDEQGLVRHAGQYISTEQGKFPNFDFLRALKRELENDEGTIFRYADHENTVLNQIYAQLIQDQVIGQLEKEELKTFIRSITHSSGNSTEHWSSPRSMVDMLKLVKDFYYDPNMGGSNSIKIVLPAILQKSEFVKRKYREPVYGRHSPILSLNFDDGWVWIQRDDSGNVINPYKLLPTLFEGVEHTEDFLTDSHYLADGGAAMTAFSKMQFTNMSFTEKEALTQGLLRYCELDTLAMVMIFEAWREWS